MESEVLKEKLDGLYKFLSRSVFRLTKTSINILNGNEPDGDFTEDRLDLMYFANNWAKADKDGYFYDSLAQVKFVREKCVAYTTPDKIITLSLPNFDVVPDNKERFQRWYFIFCHECLHQLWDTFGVGDQITKEKGSCDHELLNIASDCVINDFLANVSSNHKIPPVDGITPEYIEKRYGVKFDRNKHNQYDLYCMLDKLPSEKKNNLKKDFEQFEGKLTPKSINKVPAPPPPPGGAGQQYPPDYVKGWTDAIQAVLDKKVDPIKCGPLNDSSKSKDYNEGYDAAIKNIKKGLEEGIQLPDGGSPGESNGGGLPQIPWDIPNDDNSGSGSGSGQSNDNKQSESKSMTEAAQKAADAAKQAADQAQQIADGLSKSGEKEAAKEAQAAADAAKQSAEDAQKAADEVAKAEKAGDTKEAANKTYEAAAKAQEAASELSKAKSAANLGKDKQGDSSSSSGSNDDKTSSNGSNSDKGDTSNSSNDDSNSAEKGEQSNSSSNNTNPKDAINAADKAANAAKNAAGSNSNSSDSSSNNTDSKDNSKDGSKQAGKDVGDLFDRELIEEARQRGEQIIDKWKDSLSGNLGKFVKMSKNAKSLKTADIIAQTNSRNGGSWNKELIQKCDLYITKFFRNLNTQKEKTWNRMNRRAGVVRSGESKVMTKGKRVIKNKIGFDINLYIDTSGSMGGVIDKVFKASYDIVETLVNTMGKHREYVKKDEINTKAFIFTTQMREIKYGQTASANGGTYSFHDLVRDIHKSGKASFINIIVTDGGFGGIDNEAICNTLKEMNGMIFLVTNNMDNKSIFNSLKRKADSVTPNKLEIVYADDNFTIKK